jgi:hypothetical protein
MLAVDLHAPRLINVRSSRNNIAADLSKSAYAALGNARLSARLRQSVPPPIRRRSAAIPAIACREGGETFPRRRIIERGEVILAKLARAFALAFFVMPFVASGHATAKPIVVVGFVLDTTGSMGPLIEGAKRKIWSIATSIVDTNPDAEIRMGLVAYRDIGD